ncbi:GNAT family N-acetyltransferase [uncultured Oscillibacter sp.]|uniref:GNAT family N-acetyltransferase n=1 Tax=uncultured Oscillibacter sp. TaxID=876091 RepID=UPI0025E321A3|nr:GNAT family N-acetyltransferase [uncultured Oscillibacter sp.]
MEGIIAVTAENIDSEHICCAITDKKGETCVSSKKAWLKERFKDGLVFQKLDARGKVFIEYIPAEKAWCPMDAPGYLHINCFWVSGQYKGKGYASRLLETCVEDAKAKGCCGLTVVASEKKRPFLSDAAYLKQKGFLAADTARPYFVLYYLPFTETAPVPRFKDCAKAGRIEETGMVLYYTNQCPHTDKYVPVIVKLAEERGAKISVHKIETTAQAQSAPTPFTTYGFFYNGEYVTNEIFGPSKFEKFLSEHGF